MPWSANIIDPNIVELVYTGEVTPAELMEALQAAGSLSHKHQTNLFLADCTEMAGGHSITDLYFLISAYEAAGLQYGSKEALLLPKLKSPAEEVKFYEVACSNRGFIVKIFIGRHEALQWLRGSAPGE
jgi:hypothetical protein